MMTQTKRARIQKLVDGCKRGDSHQQISFNFGEVWSSAENEDPLDLTEMKGGLDRGPQRFEDVHIHQRREGPPCGFFNLQAKTVKHRSTRIALPRKRPAQLEQFSVKTLQATGFREGPFTDARSEEKR